MIEALIKILDECRKIREPNPNEAGIGYWREMAMMQEEAIQHIHNLAEAAIDEAKVALGVKP